MRVHLSAVLLFASSCTIAINGAQLRPSPVRASPDLPYVPVELAKAVEETPICAQLPEVSVQQWREAVEGSVKALVGVPREGPKGKIVLELMEPVCAVERTTVGSQVRFRARLYGADGAELAATNGLSTGVTVSSQLGNDGLLKSLSSSLELATQQALTPLLAQAR